jgi:serine phosphatase RsbU (regulator of sigma subunit)
VVATRQARAGIPISVKLILATSIVVAAAVGVVTWFSQAALADVTKMQIEARRQAGELAIQRGSVQLVQSIAKVVALPVSSGMIPELKPAFDAALAEDKETGDQRVTWLVVADATGDMSAWTESKLDKAQAAAQVAAHDRLLANGVKSGQVMHAKIGGTDWVYRVPVMLATQRVGTLWMGVTTAGLEQELQASLDRTKQRVESTRDRVWLVSLVILAIGIVLAALQGVQLARPIKALTVQAHRIAGGDFATRVPENRRDELGVLARTFNDMADEIRALLVDQRQKASLEKEMSLARQVQQAMLPPDTLDEHGAMKIVGYCMPASSCGGDWWTYRKLANGRMLLVVGDATGHGIHSAMIAATARGAVEALSGIDERLLTPEQVLRAIDSAIRQVGDHNVLMTAFAAVFDSTHGILHYANAGQNFPYVIKLGSTRLLEAASIIAASGNPLGDRNIAIEIRRGSLQLRPGDLFVCFTDGVVERANPAGKLFGDRRLRSALTGQSLADGNALVRLRDLIVQTLDQYAEGTNADDDITLVLCHYDPPAARQSGRGAA